MKEKEKLKKIRNCKEPTKVVESDLKDIQKEINMLKEEINILSKNRKDNKLDIYKRAGGILNRQEFADFLIDVLEYRKNLKL